ncbi:MAG: protein kinase [Desulfobacterales bacterium]|nr:protein kinase [Desulfobacterales bacterium]
MKTIGPYTIRERLGKGSMGSVYKVLMPETHKIAALKILDPSPKLVEKMGFKWVRDRFMNEASVISNIHHPHVVDVFRFESENDPMFYLMEFFPHNLGTYLKETYWADAVSRTVPVKRATRLIIQILDGLGRLHRSGIVHRDIKPFNIMLTHEGNVKITDFGLSKKRGEPRVSRDGAKKEDLFIGTKHYAAPEQVKSPENADHRADLYSGGVLMYRMLTGRLPRAGGYKKPSLLNPELDETWDGFIAKSMATEPGKRFKTASDMAGAADSVFKRYRIKKDEECKRPDGSRTSPLLKHVSTPPPLTLRSTAQRIIARRARSVFDIDELDRPNRYLANNFQISGSSTVTDQATGLVWQQSGSRYPMNLNAATAYIERLKKERYGGFDTWRLPTVNELLSLLNPPPPGENFCLEPVFSFIQNTIWSGDARSFKAFWLVNIEMGFVTSSDILDDYFVKGVCSLPPY